MHLPVMTKKKNETQKYNNTTSIFVYVGSNNNNNQNETNRSVAILAQVYKVGNQDV